MSKDYRVSEICPYCGNALTHNPKYYDDIQGTIIEVEYGLECEKCGTIDYFSYGQWDGDCGLQMMEVEAERRNE